MQEIAPLREYWILKVKSVRTVWYYRADVGVKCTSFRHEATAFGTRGEAVNARIPHVPGAILVHVRVYRHTTIAALEERLAAWERVVRAACKAHGFNSLPAGCEECDAVRALGPHRPGES